MAVSTIKKDRLTCDSVSNNLTAPASNSLLNCTGTVTNTPTFEIFDAGHVLLGGRLLISNFVRTGGNPGAYLTLPNGLRLKTSFGVRSTGYSANSGGIRLGEMCIVSGAKDSTQILISATESYANQVSSARVWYMVSPIMIEVY